MNRYIRCQHCKKLIKINNRLKGTQRYCNSKICQQARKNRWEREKLLNDEEYLKKRKASKSKWRRKKPAHQYQKSYRESHTNYKHQNRITQRKRGRHADLQSKTTENKFVKTDALNSTGLTGIGMYKILLHKPVKGEKIVKTDTLIVEIVAQQGVQEIGRTV